ncbi:hypothetical protein FJZ33_03440 [Candidatus Poribacteria bacterium]|nr:hypothetical protein [Candidatus Poribacteria bacterium]
MIIYLFNEDDKDRMSFSFGSNKVEVEIHIYFDNLKSDQVKSLQYWSKENAKKNVTRYPPPHGQEKKLEMQDQGIISAVVDIFNKKSMCPTIIREDPRFVVFLPNHNKFFIYTDNFRRADSVFGFTCPGSDTTTVMDIGRKAQNYLNADINIRLVNKRGKCIKDLSGPYIDCKSLENYIDKLLELNCTK